MNLRWALVYVVYTKVYLDIELAAPDRRTLIVLRRLLVGAVSFFSSRPVSRIAFGTVLRDPEQPQFTKSGSILSTWW